MAEKKTTGQIIHDKNKAKAAREARRVMVAINLLAGMNYRDMAAALDVTIGTIAKDVKVILERLRTEQVEAMDKHVTIAVRQVDVMINGLWKKAASGDERAIETTLNLQRRKMQLLGLDIQRIDHTTGGQPLPTPEIIMTPVVQLSPPEVLASLELYRRLLEGEEQAASITPSE